MSDTTSTAAGPAAPGKAPKVLAIIVSWNKKQYLQRLLGDLGKLDRPPDEILAVDNASTDGTVELVRREFPHVHLICNQKNLGGTGGFNTGMRWAMERGGYDYLWLMDNDIIIHPGVLTELLKVAESDPRTALVGSRIGELEVPGRTQEIAARLIWETGAIVKLGADEIWGMPGEHVPRIYDGHYAAACSLLARVAAIEEVGIWDEKYFVFFDDIEWGVRFRRAGWRVRGASASFIEHESFWERRIFQPFQGLYLNTRNGLYFFHRFCPRKTLPRLLFHIFRTTLLHITQHFGDGRRNLARTYALSLWDFLRGRMGPPAHDFGTDTMPQTLTASGKPYQPEIPVRKGKILFWTVSASPDTVRTIEAFRQRFPRHRVDVFLPTKVPEANAANLGPYLQRSTLTMKDRLATGRWILKNYDAVTRDYRRNRLPFDLLFPISIWYSAKGEITFMRNRWYHLAVMVLLRPLVYLGAAALTLAALLKPRGRADYFTWSRRVSTPATPAEVIAPSRPESGVWSLESGHKTTESIGLPDSRLQTSLPTVSVVIPAYNANEVLGECLEAIRRLQYPREKMEVLVIDNNSTDSTSAETRAKGFEPLLCSRPGASAARNTGIEKAKGEIVAFTDSDVIVEPDWLLRIVEPFRDPRVGGVGGAIGAYRAVTGSEFHAVASGMLDQERQLAGRPPYMLPFAATANAAYRASALQEVKGFDETLGVGEDADLSWRIQWAGYKMVYAPAAKVHHKFRSTRKAYFRQTYEYGKATVDLFKKHHRRLGLRVWIEWPHLRATVWALARAPIMPCIGRTPWARVGPLYDLAGCLAWLAGRIVRSIQRGVLVI